MNYDDEMTARAVLAHVRRTTSKGQTVNQPSATLSGRVGNIVTLENSNGRLARYRVGKHRSGAEFIRFLD